MGGARNSEWNVSPDDGWEIDVRCPHGVMHRGPLKALRGFEPLIDVCETAKRERALRDAQPKKLSWKQRRLAKKLDKRLIQDLESLNAPNADPPPSSKTTESPSPE